MVCDRVCGVGDRGLRGCVVVMVGRCDKVFIFIYILFIMLHF